MKITIEITPEPSDYTAFFKAVSDPDVAAACMQAMSAISTEGVKALAQSGPETQEAMMSIFQQFMNVAAKQMAEETRRQMIKANPMMAMFLPQASRDPD